MSKKSGNKSGQPLPEAVRNLITGKIRHQLREQEKLLIDASQIAHEKLHDEVLAKIQNTTFVQQNIRRKRTLERCVKRRPAKPNVRVSVASGLNALLCFLFTCHLFNLFLYTPLPIRIDYAYNPACDQRNHGNIR